MTDSVINERYRIECEIGSGGMADVYKAFDIIEKRFVALKLIKAEYCVDPKYVKRFEKEANTVLNLRCRNIACAYDYGIYLDRDGVERSYIALEYVEGCNLKDSIKEHGPVSPRMAEKLILSVLDALECAHNAGYIHSDVKSQNILIATDKTVKLTDFGIAKDAASNTQNYEGPDVVGSVHYISPEQANGEKVEKQSDIYSAGIVLYEMLIGRTPYDGDNAVQVALQHITGTITPPMEIDPSIPPALSDVVMKATAKNPSDRYESVTEMKKDINKAIFHPNRRLASIPDEHGAEPSDKGNTRQKTHVWNVVIPVVAAVAMVVGIFVVWFALMSNRSAKNKYTRVPDLCGKTKQQAEQLLNQRELSLTVCGTTYSDDYPEGTVCRQEPVEGVSIEKGSTVTVYISEGSNIVQMVNLVGMTLDEATAALRRLGLNVGNVTYVESDAAPGTVIWQSVSPNRDIVIGDEVDIEISLDANR